MTVAQIGAVAVMVESHQMLDRAEDRASWWWTGWVCGREEADVRPGGLSI